MVFNVFPCFLLATLPSFHSILFMFLVPLAFPSPRLAVRALPPLIQEEVGREMAVLFTENGLFSLQVAP